MAEQKIPNLGDELRAKYPGNSNTKPESERLISKPKEEEKRTEKIIKGTVAVRKKSLGRKFAEVFLGDNLKNVGQNIVKNVIVPTIKITIDDVLGGGLHMLLWGDTNFRRGGYSQSGSRYYLGGGNNSSSYTTGNSLYANTNRSVTPVNDSRSVQEVIFHARADAEDVLSHMYELLEEFGAVRVMDFYESVGYSSNDFTNNYWGWKDLRGSDIRPTRDGFVIIFPRVISLK